MKTEMNTGLFHEMYGRYFLIAGELLRRAQARGQLTLNDIQKTAGERGFAETALRLPDMLTSGEGASALFEQGDGESFKTFLEPVTRPLSLLERRWLAAVLKDPRMRLFMDDSEIARASALLNGDASKDAGGVEPLFDDENYCRFDVGRDSDDYLDPSFRETFRTVLSALREGSALEVEFLGYIGEQRRKTVIPLKIEYSMRDDLFRLIYQEAEQGRVLPIRIRRIERVTIVPGYEKKYEKKKEKKTENGSPEMSRASVSVLDDNSALELAHIRFANYRVSVESVEPGARILKISYPSYEEDTLIAAVLSFGPAARVLAPSSMAGKIRAKLVRQAQMMEPWTLNDA
jgi:hypothetical protein